MKTLYPKNCGSSRRHLRLHTKGKIYENVLGVLRNFKEFSTVMRISTELLRGMRILEGKRAKIKIVVINHNLK